MQWKWEKRGMVLACLLLCALAFASLLRPLPLRAEGEQVGAEGVGNESLEGVRQGGMVDEQALNGLSGMIVAIDAGHGGSDGGAVGGFTRVPEKTLNLDVSNRVAELLRQVGVQVVMTREGEGMLCPESVPLGKKKKTDMAMRKDRVVEGGAQLIVSIHMNKYPDAGVHGAQVFYQQGDEVGKAFATKMQGALLALDERNTRLAQAGDFYMLRIGPPAVLVECGFLSNREEEKMLSSPEYRQRVAECIVRGLAEYVKGQ